jgi:hypothetical protein
MLRRPGWRSVALGALARVLWYVFGVPCAWSLPRGAEREDARWVPSDGASREGCEAEDEDENTHATHASRLDALRRALRSAGASDVKHVVGSFDEHLARVSRILTQWGAPEHVVRAGYGHTVYGSELFPVRLASLSRSSRAAVREMVGGESERLMFLYGTCSQKRWYRTVLRREFDEGGIVDFTETATATNPSVSGTLQSRCAENLYFPRTTLHLTRASEAFVSMMHAADIAATLPSLIETDRSVGLPPNASRAPRSTRPSIPEVFALRLLRHALRVARAEKDVTREFPNLERSLVSAVRDFATEIRCDGITERAALESLRKYAWDWVFVLRATGMA